jgi:beta-lactam-binding protein with PASTA domain
LCIGPAVLVLGTGLGIGLGLSGSTSPRTTTPINRHPRPAWTGFQTIFVPQFLGTTQEQATTTLRSLGMTASISIAPSNTVPSGTVMTQYPKAGTEVARTSPISLLVSTGPPGTTTVPGAGGMSPTQAEALIAGAGLQPVLQWAPSPEPEFTIVAVSPVGGSVVPLGTTVTITVSNGALP